MGVVRDGEALTWKSLHEKHAIERSRIEINFAEPIPPKLVNTFGDQLSNGLISLGFSGRTPRAVTNFVINQVAGGLPQPSASQAVVGWQFVRTGSTGAPIEAVVLDPQSFVYETTEYVRWDVFLERFETVCRECLTALDAVTSVQKLILDYTDRFFFIGRSPDAEPKQLLRSEIIASLPPSVASGQELWHLHRGWFEGTGTARVLMNQNFDAQQGQDQTGNEIRSVQLYTRSEKHAEFRGLDTEGLHSDLKSMHDRCNAAVKWSLTAKMRTAVGLNI